MKSYEKPEEKTSRVNGMLDKLQDMPKGKLSSIHVEPAENGFSVRVHRDLPPKPAPEQAEGDGSDQVGGSASQAPGSQDGTSTHVFTKASHALAHMKHHMGGGE
jgi:hypothetical protein